MEEEGEECRVCSWWRGTLSSALTSLLLGKGPGLPGSILYVLQHPCCQHSLTAPSPAALWAATVEPSKPRAGLRIAQHNACYN